MQCSAGKRRLRSNPCRTERMLGRWTNCSTKRWLWNRQSPMHLAHHNICYTYPQHCICLNITVLYPTLHQYKHATYTAASGDGDLDGVTPPRAHILQVERFVGWLVLSPLNVKRGCVDTDGDGGWPVGVLLPVLMVETLQLQLQVWPAHITNTASFNSLFTSLSVHIITNTASFNSLFTVCAHHLLTAYSLSVHIITNTTSVNNLLSLHIITNRFF